MNVPQGSFDWPVCGHEKIVDFLQRALVSDRIAQAYLFYGPPNLGKNFVATNFTASLLCRGREISPCGQCADCRQWQKGWHPDVNVVRLLTDEKTGKPRQEIIIDQIRELKARLQQGTLLSGYKVAIFPEAQWINVNAANALLKLVEEPTAKTVIILVATDLSSLPRTIISRCQTLKFLPVPVKVIREFMKKQGDDNSVDWPALSFGRPGLALTLKQAPELWEQRQKNQQAFIDLLSLSLGRRLNLAEDFLAWGKEESSNLHQALGLLADWQILVRDLLLYKSDADSLVSDKSRLAQLRPIACRFSFVALNDFLNKIAAAKINLFKNLNVKIVLENLIVNL